MAYKNKEDQAIASAKHYEANKQKVKNRSKVRNRNQRKWARSFLSRVKRLRGCIDCGESNPVVLDFDHVKGKKTSNLSDMANHSYSIKRMKEEIRKCEVRCSNCHRKKTFERRSNMHG